MGCVGSPWQIQSTYLNKKKETERQIHKREEKGELEIR